MIDQFHNDSTISDTVHCLGKTKRLLGCCYVKYLTDYISFYLLTQFTLVRIIFDFILFPVLPYFLILHILFSLSLSSLLYYLASSSFYYLCSPHPLYSVTLPHPHCVTYCPHPPYTPLPLFLILLTLLLFTSSSLFNKRCSAMHLDMLVLKCFMNY